jgi:SPP1 family predicted phage head-tail adaptor
MSLAAGRLRHRVGIEIPIESRDASGNRSITWQEIARVWAAIRMLRGRELFAAQQVNSRVIAEITIRRRDDLNSKMRITNKQDIFAIEGIMRDQDSGIEFVTINASIGINRG